MTEDATLQPALPSGAAPGAAAVPTPEGSPGLSRTTATLLAFASGQAVATAYYAQPLLDVMARDFAIDQGAIGLVGTATQVGYGLGLLLIVPLGDVFPRRWLIAGLLSLSAPALVTAAVAPTGIVLLCALAVTGALAVVAQVIVAYAATRANSEGRGRAVAVVTSGIIIGILLARAVAGSLADLFGWRSVYSLSAAAAIFTALALLYVLPRERKPALRVTYPRLVFSVVALFWELPILRARAFLAFLIFFAITTLLTPLALVLSAEPFGLSHTEIGLFGLAGAAGALGATVAGRWSDEGRAERTSALALALMLLAWIPSALLSVSVLGLVVGVIVMDFGLQAAHVTNQSLIYRVRPDARSRLAAAYMLLYSAGCAGGSIASTLAFANGGWPTVCLLGSATSMIALLFWIFIRHVSNELPK